MPATPIPSTAFFPSSLTAPRHACGSSGRRCVARGPVIGAAWAMAAALVASAGSASALSAVADARAVAGVDAGVESQPAADGAEGKAERSPAELAAARAEAVKLFTESGEAMRSYGAMTGTFRFATEGSEALASVAGGDLTGTMMVMPSGVTAEERRSIRDSAWGSEWLVRFTGAGKIGPQDATETSFDVVFGPLKTTWLDTEAETVFQRTPSAALQRSKIGSALKLLAVRDFATAMPLEAVRDAESYTIEPNQTLQGIVCRVVKVKHKPETVNGGGSWTPGKPFALNESRYFIGADDLVLRRVERIGDFGMGLSLSFVTEFPDLGPEEGLSAADFEIPVPDGFQMNAGSSAATDRLVRPDRAGEGVDAGAGAEPPALDETPKTTANQKVMAPAFSLPDGSGGTVSLADMAGEVTVLYWWGTWCIPCRDVSPLVSEMAAEYADKGVNVIGMAYRERDPEQPKSYIASKGYGFQLALADDATAKAYNVRAYPSVFVIGKDGAIELVTNRAARADVAREEQSAAMMGDVRNAVDAALGG